MLPMNSRKMEPTGERFLSRGPFKIENGGRYDRFTVGKERVHVYLASRELLGRLVDPST